MEITDQTEDELFRVRLVDGDYVEIDGQALAFTTLADAIYLADHKAAERFASGASTTDNDIEIVFGDDALTLPEARQQLIAQVLTEAGEMFEAIAARGEYEKDRLVQLANQCKVATRSYTG